MHLAKNFIIIHKNKEKSLKFILASPFNRSNLKKHIGATKDTKKWFKGYFRATQMRLSTYFRATQMRLKRWQTPKTATIQYAVLSLFYCRVT